MPSPFPGMNPYLEHEDAWRDFHQSFMPIAREFLAPQVRPHYFVKVEENIYIHERSESYSEIRDRQTRRLVTVLELLSPTNKRAGEDRNSYITKRQYLLRSDAHFIEIDLLRGLPRMPYVELPDHDYYALVSRAEKRPEVDLWPIRLRDPLPVLPVPLQAPHADALLDLQAVLHRIYDSALYADFIYAHAPQPALSPADAAWAQTLIPAQE